MWLGFSASDLLNHLYSVYFFTSFQFQVPSLLLSPLQMWVRSLVWEDPLEKEMATHSSMLAWEIPWTEEPGWLQSTRLQRCGHDWATEQMVWWLFKQLSRITIWSSNSASWGIPRRNKGKDSKKYLYTHISVSSVAQSYLTLWDPMDCSTPGLPVHHKLPEPTQAHVQWVGDAIQLSHPLSAPSLPAFNLSQHQELFQWVGSSHQVAKGLEFPLQHQSFQWIFRTDFLYTAALFETGKKKKKWKQPKCPWMDEWINKMWYWEKFTPITLLSSHHHIHFQKLLYPQTVSLCVCVCVCTSPSVVYDSLRSHGL